jgi:predicted DsbA family dithiol-disulfide isomerase
VIAQLSDQASFEVHFHPFELNPNMPLDGRDAIENFLEKYSLTPMKESVIPKACLSIND